MSIHPNMRNQYEAFPALLEHLTFVISDDKPSTRRATFQMAHLQQFTVNYSVSKCARFGFGVSYQGKQAWHMEHGVLEAVVQRTVQ
jgi:hypothetical protein